ncbi:MAG: phosphoribosylformylglycinamidine synthase II [Gammaproteobacteria bacterium RIFCSPHIGHO2_12_FULL_35_23]|nr:MAG: phosphoribosylformylglycinamidine synthase II [Gammaproteobacteria bacterium RIFCSPHIGHO2_12_FULL_35_23]
MAFTEQRFDFNSLTPEQIRLILQQNNIALTVDEILTVQKLLNRSPTLTECILWSIQGSEHCSYKSTRPYLKQFPTDAPNVILGPKEDAGIVCVAKDNQGHRYGIVISHESHNHPSQIVPYEGAATGVGGNVRDVCCMGGKVIALADSLRFGSIENNHTHWIHQGVVAGIAGYGNPLGIPNLAGDVYYDEAYQQNCLVTVVTLGVLREDEIIHSYAPQAAEGYNLILVGKPTDKSGFGGASFASLELDDSKQEQNRGAVQEPNAFLGRHLLAANYALFDLLKSKNLLSEVGFKDLGAGGVACASVELAENAGYGAEIDLTLVHTTGEKLHPTVILCSETQERYMWVAPPDLTPLILKHYNETYALPKVSQGAQARIIGKIRKEGQFIVNFQNQQLVNAKASDVTRGLIYNRPYQAKVTTTKEPILPSHNLTDTLLKLLAHENIASQQAVFEKYDKQVQGRTYLERGLAETGVLQPFNSEDFPAEIRETGIALSVGANPRYGKIDAYWCAVNAVVTCMRQVACVGATPETITDCLCFGNPEKPEQMYEIIQAILGIKAALEAIPLKEHPNFATPVIAGNVSLYNETANQAIPASPIISCLGKLKNINQAINYSFKQTDSIILMIGERKDECGASIYYSLFHELGKNLPQPNCEEVAKQIYALTDAIDKSLILSAHTIKQGGIAVCLAEMTFNQEIGFEVTIPGTLSLEKLLFSETGGFVLEIAFENLSLVQAIFNQYGLKSFIIGCTTSQKNLNFNKQIILPLAQAKPAWQQGLRERLL